jgi:hypothetical protein
MCIRQLAPRMQRSCQAVPNYCQLCSNHCVICECFPALSLVIHSVCVINLVIGPTNCIQLLPITKKAADSILVTKYLLPDHMHYYFFKHDQICIFIFVYWYLL